MSEAYECRKQNHAGDLCVGFCLNKDCQHPSQFCVQCMKYQHLDHQDDCLGFVEIKKWLGDLIQAKTYLNENLTKIQTKFIELIEEAKKLQQKQIDQCLVYQKKIQEQNYADFSNNIKDIKLLYQNHNNRQQNKEILKSYFGYSTKVQNLNQIMAKFREIILSLDQNEIQQKKEQIQLSPFKGRSDLKKVNYERTTIFPTSSLPGYQKQEHQQPNNYKYQNPENNTIIYYQQQINPQLQQQEQYQYSMLQNPRGGGYK